MRKRLRRGHPPQSGTSHQTERDASQCGASRDQQGLEDGLEDQGPIRRTDRFGDGDLHTPLAQRGQVVVGDAHRSDQQGDDPRNADENAEVKTDVKTEVKTEVKKSKKKKRKRMSTIFPGDDYL